MAERERYWRRVLAEWRRSGLSRAAYCRQRGISYATLNFWKSRIAALAEGGSSRKHSRFVEVAVGPGAADAGIADYEIVLAGGQRLRIPRGFDADEVSRLLALVSSC